MNCNAGSQKGCILRKKINLVLSISISCKNSVLSIYHYFMKKFLQLKDNSPPQPFGPLIREVLQHNKCNVFISFVLSKLHIVIKIKCKEIEFSMSRKWRTKIEFFLHQEWSANINFCERLFGILVFVN